MTPPARCPRRARRARALELEELLAELPGWHRAPAAAGERWRFRAVGLEGETSAALRAGDWVLELRLELRGQGPRWTALTIGRELELGTVAEVLAAAGRKVHRR